MGSISVSGTGWAAPILVLAILAQAATVRAGDDASLTVSVAGLRNQRGQVHICLTANARAFPDCSKDAAAFKRTVRAADAGSISFTAIAPGTYALSLIHDENGNGKLDTTLAIPREGFGFSRNPRIAFGPPKFAAAAFALTGHVSQTVKMKYML